MIKADSTYYWMQLLIIGQHLINYQKKSCFKCLKMEIFIREEQPKDGNYVCPGRTDLPPGNHSRIWKRHTRSKSLNKQSQEEYKTKLHSDAYEIDKETGTGYWHQAIMKEMKNNMIEECVKIPVGSKWIPFHMIFNVKLDLTRKAWFVASGHWTDPPTQVSYSSVVIRKAYALLSPSQH